MASQFPLFSKLTLEDKNSIEKITSQFEPYSDFNFTSLFCWNLDGSTEISNLQGNLVIKLADYLSGEIILSILGDSSINESIHTIMGLKPKLDLIPKAVIDRLKDKSQYKIVEDRDSFDYIYNTNELAGLSGQKFKKKRNKINKFNKSLATRKLEIRVSRSPDRIELKPLYELCQKWSKETSQQEGDFYSERKAIRRLLSHFSELNLVLIEVVIDGQLVAFSANEIVNKDYAICHFEKALKTSGDNVYTYLASESAKVIRNLGPQYINWEQDLGLDGLRKSKLAYHPVGFLKKYSIFNKS